MYTERATAIRDAVAWSSMVTNAEQHRVLPDGCLDLLWTDGQLRVAGPDTVAYLAAWKPGTPFVGLRLGSGLGPRVLGVPAHLLRDQRVPLEQLWPGAEVRRLSERLAAAPDPSIVLEEVATKRLAANPAADGVAAQVARRLGQGARIDAVADEVGLSARQLHRRSLDAFGYGPKTLARILRMNRAVALSRSGTPAAEVAFAAGYADQAHLSRDVRSLAGVTLTALVT
ncbi:helix-turn-helix transcriptional regulator [Jiangella asiatica]|uniref:AraC family transcriptional regulator n=1 Tax=Jiangella asiatica TaxID=2530372 RepID=A0A4R5DJG8_9ACTN|nr:helix-turn-helix transcriptional regulator [Jiangella asiatica]TDE10955.1 AraC family transcriptional regulator [Jiangella asiatica]